MKSENLNSKYHLVFLLGTASLVIGLILILIGFFFILSAFVEFAPTPEDARLNLLLRMIFGIPLIVGGAFYLRKFDKDKKKE